MYVLIFELCFTSRTRFACFVKLFESCQFVLRFPFSLQPRQRHEKLVMNTGVIRLEHYRVFEYRQGFFVTV